MSINLLRNSKVYFTTNVEADPNAAIGVGGILANGFDDTNAFEIQVLDDLSFGQTTASETISINETGSAPKRGQRTFNTALNPVEFSFTTYMRPYDDTTSVSAEEAVLWNAMFGDAAYGAIGAAWTDSTTGTTPATLVVTGSNKHQLQRFGLIIMFDDNCFLLDDCALNSATIDFGIDAIASIQWSGQARKIRRIAPPTITTAGGFTTWTVSLVGGTAGSANAYRPKITAAPFIANKLTTITLWDSIGVAGTAPTTGNSYNLPLTGGSITLTNNITYLTPAYMASVNEPITYFTGSRSITGTLNAYLRTGSSASGGLMTDLINQITTDADPEFYLSVNVGGASAPYVKLEMPAVVLSIPTVNTDQVITTSINFTAQGSNSTNKTFDILQDNEIKISYYA